MNVFTNIEQNLIDSKERIIFGLIGSQKLWALEEIFKTQLGYFIIYRETIEMLRASFIPVTVIEMGDVSFSRGVALMRGAETLPANALLFFTDVDMLFTCDALKRIKSNTILNAQIYFPIVFSEFSHESWSENDKLLADAFHYGRGRGYFRHFGYGLAAMYKVRYFEKIFFLQ